MCKVCVRRSPQRKYTDWEKEQILEDGKQGEQGVYNVLVIVGTISGAGPQVGSVDVWNTPQDRARRKADTEYFCVRYSLKRFLFDWIVLKFPWSQSFNIVVSQVIRFE
jgi:hypothetical protein